MKKPQNVDIIIHAGGEKNPLLASGTTFDFTFDYGLSILSTHLCIHTLKESDQPNRFSLRNKDTPTPLVDPSKIVLCTYYIPSFSHPLPKPRRAVVSATLKLGEAADMPPLQV